MLARATFLVLAGVGCSAAAADSLPLYENLGEHSYAVTTENPEAQLYFNQGLRLYYAFNHAESVRSFQRAQRLDPDCAMCFWGEALALGPNINAALDSASGVAAFAAIGKAKELEQGANARERALIDALSRRYEAVPRADRAVLDSAYAIAMDSVHRAYPEDNEVSVLYAEAQMDLRPWDYWTPNGELHPGMPNALAELERVTASDARHPGACHFYIHLVEAAFPERAVACAERLAGLMPGAGHLVHMPGHIYIRVGRYLDAIEANEHAVHADETYIRDQAPSAGIYTAGYYPHNYDFLSFAAAMAGKKDQALTAADKLSELAAKQPMSDPRMIFTQHHYTRVLQVAVRFEDWDRILISGEPGADLLHARAMWHYARGRALVGQGRIDEAEKELTELRSAVQDSRLKGVRLEFNESQPILGVAESVLSGVIHSARGEHDDAARDLGEAAAREDALGYGEPPDWTVPVRHDLGAVLLKAGRAADAERVFREDLKRFPDNGWSLGGLASSLRAQKRDADADAVEKKVEEWRRLGGVPSEGHKH